MKKAIKILLISLVSLFLLVIVAGYVVLSQVDFNNYKTVIQKSVKESTGRDLAIGDIKVVASFNPTIEVKEVSFSNASWAKSPNMVEAKSIRLSVGLLPLLSKNFVINNFKISDAVVNLSENKEGNNNWTFGSVDAKEVVKNTDKVSFDFSFVKTANASTSSMLSSVSIKEIMLNNIQINYTDKKQNLLAYNVKNLSLTENSKRNIDFDFDVNNGEYKGKGVLGNLRIFGENAGYPIIANLDIMGINIVTEVKLFNVFDNLTFEGKAKVKKFLGKNSSFDENLDVAFSGGLKNVLAKIRELKVAGNIVNGNVECDLSTKVPFIKAVFNSSNIDILSFQKNKKVALIDFVVKNANATSLAPNEVIPYDVLRMVNLDGKVNIAKLMRGDKVLGADLSLLIGLNNGKASINVDKGVLAKGVVKGGASLSALNRGLDVDFGIEKLNLLNLVDVLGVNSSAFNFISGGNSDVHLKLKSSGETYSSLVENLDGNMVFIIDNSKVHLGNIGMMKGNIVSQLFNALNLTKGNDELNMTCAVVRADFKDKKIDFPNGIVVNADKFTVVADGDVNLKNDALSFSVKPFAGKLTDTNIAKALSSLVKLTGTIDNPKIGIDSANAIKTIVGVTTAGPVYLGAQMLLESDGSPCYSALEGTGYEQKFPKPKNVVSETTNDVGQILNDSVGSVKDTTKGLLNLLSGGLTGN